MTCPKCDSKLKPYISVKEGNVSYRIKVCVECKKKVYTKAVEEICPQYEVLKKINNRQYERNRKRFMEELRAEREGAKP